MFLLAFLLKVTIEYSVSLYSYDFWHLNNMNFKRDCVQAAFNKEWSLFSSTLQYRIHIYVCVCVYIYIYIYTYKYNKLNNMRQKTLSRIKLIQWKLFYETALLKWVWVKLEVKLSKERWRQRQIRWPTSILERQADSHNRVPADFCHVEI